MSKNEILTSIKIADSFFELATMFEKIKNFELAIANYQRALEYDSNYKLARDNMARLYVLAK